MLTAAIIILTIAVIVLILYVRAICNELDDILVEIEHLRVARVSAIADTSTDNTYIAFYGD